MIPLISAIHKLSSGISKVEIVMINTHKSFKDDYLSILTFLSQTKSINWTRIRVLYPKETVSKSLNILDIILPNFI